MRKTCLIVVATLLAISVAAIAWAQTQPAAPPAHQQGYQQNKAAGGNERRPHQTASVIHCPILVKNQNE